VYSKDDCGKLKSKDSYNTRRFKQNTYHVVKKYSLKYFYRWIEDKRGEAKLRCLSLNISLGCLGDRGKGVPSFDEMMDIALVEVDFDDPTTNVRGRRALAIAKPTPRGY